MAARIPLRRLRGSGGRSDAGLPGLWQPQPITVDGSNKDWPSPYPQYDENAQIGYAVSNDKANLYITVETGDPATQLKIIKQGLTVWIDRKGEKNELTAINFPIPAAGADKPSGIYIQQGQGSAAQQKQRMDIEDKVKQAMESANEYSLQGFKACNLQFPIQENDTCGVKVRMSIDEDNELVWEAVVPFRSFYFKPEISRPDRGKALSICMETTAMKRPEGQAKGNRGNGGGSGMRPGFSVGGMGLGMGMGGGMSGGNRSSPQLYDPMEPAYKSTKTWKRFGIAYDEPK